MTKTAAHDEEKKTRAPRTVSPEIQKAREAQQHAKDRVAFVTAQNAVKTLTAQIAKAENTGSELETLIEETKKQLHERQERLASLKTRLAEMDKKLEAAQQKVDDLKG